MSKSFCSIGDDEEHCQMLFVDRNTQNKHHGLGQVAEASRE